MRITCPFCGERDHAEFAYLGDAGPSRPAVNGHDGGEEALFHDYVYLRANPPGWHREYWQHAGGCRAWLVVERNITSHAICAVRAARDAGAAGAGRLP